MGKPAILQCAMSRTRSCILARNAPRPQTDRRERRRTCLAWTHTARFLTTASQLDQLPATELPEIAFVGRSNAGKSTAINRLTQQKRLAFASQDAGPHAAHQPVRAGPKGAPNALFADLPGYGYAAVARARQAALAEGDGRLPGGARSLTGVVLMVDSRLGFTELDRQLARLRRAARGQRRGARCWCC